MQCAWATAPSGTALHRWSLSTSLSLPLGCRQPVGIADFILLCLDGQVRCRLLGGAQGAAGAPQQFVFQNAILRLFFAVGAARLHVFPALPV